MEDFIKLFTTEQTKRTEFFMFIWKILMAMLTTEHIMRDFNYYYSNEEITSRSLINFIISEQFIWVVFIYLLLISIFFWGIRFSTHVVLIISSIIIRLLISKDMFFAFFELLTITKKGDNNEFYIKDKKSFEFIQNLIDDKDTTSIINWQNSITSIILSTTFWISTFDDKIKIPYKVDSILYYLTIFMLIQLFGTMIFLLSMKIYDGKSYFLSLQEKGFYSEINQKRDEHS